MAESMNTLLGKDATLNGTLEVAGSLRVDGFIKGMVISRETVVVGPTGRVEGDITSKVSTIAGHVIGNVVAEERVELQAKAILQGDLKTKGLVIEQGAVFHGACRMKMEGAAVENEPVKTRV